MEIFFSSYAKYCSYYTNNIVDLDFQFDTGSLLQVPNVGVNNTLINVPSDGVNYIGYSIRTTGWDPNDSYMYYAVYDGSLTEAQLQQNFQAFVTSSFA